MSNRKEEKMATKPVKKTAVKKAATAKPAAATEAKAAPAAQCSQSCGCGCGCKGGFGRFIKKLIVFIIIFALGFAAAKFCTIYKMHKGFRGPHVEFVNGCMDIAKIPCPEMAAKMAMADVNGDGCITKEEFKTIKKEMRREFRGEKRGCGRDCDCGQRGEQPAPEMNG